MRAEEIVNLDNVVEYRKKFDTFVGFNEGFGPSINDYMLPDELPETAEHFEELIRKSLADGHDYLLDYAKERGVKIVYDPDKVY